MGDIRCHFQQRQSSSARRYHLLSALRYLTSTKTCLLGTSTEPLGTVKPITVTSVLSKTLLPNQTHQCLQAPLWWPRAVPRTWWDVCTEEFSLVNLLKLGAFVPGFPGLNVVTMNCFYTWISLTMHGYHEPRERSTNHGHIKAKVCAT